MRRLIDSQCGIILCVAHSERSDRHSLILRRHHGGAYQCQAVVASPPPPLCLSHVCVCVCVSGRPYLPMWCTTERDGVTAWQQAAATYPGLLGSVHVARMPVPAVQYALRRVARYAVAPIFPLASSSSSLLGHAQFSRRGVVLSHGQSMRHDSAVGGGGWGKFWRRQCSRTHARGRCNHRCHRKNC